MRKTIRKRGAPRNPRFGVEAVAGQFWSSAGQLVVGRVVRCRGVLCGDVRLFVGQGCTGADGLTLTHGQLVELRGLVDLLIGATAGGDGAEGGKA